MKTFLFPLTLFLVACLQTTTGQDTDKRFETFLTDSLAGFPEWLRKHGHVPDPLESIKDGNFTLNSVRGDGYPYYEIVGEFTNRVYHGADNNFRFLNISANLTSLSFIGDLAYGDGVNDSVEGTYLIEGSLEYITSISGKGKFSRTQLRNPLHTENICFFEILPTGFFELWFCINDIHRPKFDKLTLNETKWETGYYLDLKDIINAWYNGQINDFPRTFSYWFDYMNEVFAATPIIDIIGTTLPPTVTTSYKRSDTPVYTKTNYLDAETNEWIQRVAIRL